VIYIGDFAKGSVTVRHKFNTRKGDGTPITLAGTPVAKGYEDAGTAEFTTGITLTVDFDGKTGLHMVEIDLSQSEYEEGKDYTIFLSAGTVDGVSVVGAIVCSFSIENRSIDPDPITNLCSIVEDVGGGVYALKLTALANLGDYVFEATDTLDDYFRLSSAVLYRKAVGLNSSTPIFYAEDDTTPRVSDTITSGTRITVLDPS
jgi:hypothetical protein